MSPLLPAGQPMELSISFRRAMRSMAATVSVITCADEDGWHGMTATAVTPVCSEPPALLLCVNRGSAFHGRLSIAKSFCVNLLDASQVEISRAFSGRLKVADRFDSGNWTMAHCLPCLLDAQANLFCKMEQVAQFCTHGIFIATISHVFLVEDATPLLYLDRRYVRTDQLTEP